MPSLKKYDFSIIVTTFNEVKSFEEFHNRLVTPLDQNNINYELIVCDDGSNDGTLNVVKKNYLSNPKFTCVIELFRNFGQGAAMSAALTQANGKNYIIIDSDLQIAPEEVLNFILIFRNNEYDAVVGWRKERMDTTTRKIVSKIGNTIMRKASKTTLNDLGCNLKVFDGRLIENMGFGAFKSFRSVDILARA